MDLQRWVTTVVYCGRHRREAARLCVRVDRPVPPALRCAPAGPSAAGSGGTAAPGPVDCPCSGRFELADLGRRVADALRGGFGQWMTRGAVTVAY